MVVGGLAVVQIGPLSKYLSREVVLTLSILYLTVSYASKFELEMIRRFIPPANSCLHQNWVAGQKVKKRRFFRRICLLLKSALRNRCYVYAEVQILVGKPHPPTLIIEIFPLKNRCDQNIKYSIYLRVVHESGKKQSICY
jgi:hypothetical protein